jgi:hypothetical protein
VHAQRARGCPVAAVPRHGAALSVLCLLFGKPQCDCHSQRSHSEAAIQLVLAGVQQMALYNVFPTVSFAASMLVGGAAGCTGAQLCLLTVISLESLTNVNH